MSKCGKCNSFSFELAEQSPNNSNYKIFFVQCAYCKVPVGTMEYFNAGSLIKEESTKIQTKIQQIEVGLSNIDYILRQIAQRI